MDEFRPLSLLVDALARLLLDLQLLGSAIRKCTFSLEFLEIRKFVGICRNLLELSGFYWTLLLLDFIGLYCYWNLLDFTGIHWTSLEIIEF